LERTSPSFNIHHRFPTGISMRELERPPTTATGPITPAGTSLAVIGRGRLSSALIDGLRATPLRVSEGLGRRPDVRGYDAVLLCVPDGAIAEAAATIPPGPLVGHCSGATGLDVLAPHPAFSLHPLMTIPAGSGGDRLRGAAAAIAGTTTAARDYARMLATSLGMRPFALADSDRVAYHAAASVASNFLLTLEDAAERIAAGTGLNRAQLLPLVRATVENWAQLGSRAALTGPIARGDEGTVAAQRAAVQERAPDVLGLFDALTAATRSLASGPAVAA
jgi:predicted short-subunit dehydrogenase-like oxidoreductase (DUF2520 family)